MADGGSIESVAIRARIFPVAADADVSRDLGGFTNEVQSNGDGSARIIKTRKPWMLESVSLSLDDNRQDQEFLQEIIDSGEVVPVSITCANGITYGGQGTVSGDLKASLQSGTAEVTLSGPQKLEPQ